jgi:hypothetical protein
VAHGQDVDALGGDGFGHSSKLAGLVVEIDQECVHSYPLERCVTARPGAMGDWVRAGQEIVDPGPDAS